MIGLLDFACVVWHLAIFLNLLRVLLWLMSNGRMKLLSSGSATGHGFLSGFIESHSEREQYVLFKIHRWVGHI